MTIPIGVDNSLYSLNPIFQEAYNKKKIKEYNDRNKDTLFEINFLNIDLKPYPLKYYNYKDFNNYFVITRIPKGRRAGRAVSQRIIDDLQEKARNGNIAEQQEAILELTKLGRGFLKKNKYKKSKKKIERKTKYFIILNGKKY